MYQFPLGRLKRFACEMDIANLRMISNSIEAGGIIMRKLEGIRAPRQLRRLMLYPIELQAREKVEGKDDQLSAISNRHLYQYREIFVHIQRHVSSLRIGTFSWKRLEIHGGELCYRGASPSEARQLGKYLVQTGFFDGSKKGVQLRRDSKAYHA